MYISENCNWTSYGTKSDLDKLVDSLISDTRISMVKQNYGLDKLIYDKDKFVREAVAEQGYGLDILINDKDWNVRCAVARQKYGLDTLIYDKDYEVRTIVAEQGYGLDKLINDTDRDVRAAVARNGYKLDILINDKSHWVREEVAWQKYGLDKLINDENNNVRIAVAYQGYKLDILINDKDWAVRRAVANMGYGLDKLINDKNVEVHKAVLEYLNENGITLREWYEQNGKEYSKLNSDLIDFLYKVLNCSKLKVQTKVPIETFFDDMSDKSYEDKESISIITADTKIPIIVLQKILYNNKKCFEFIIDIKNGINNFNSNTIFDTKNQFDQLVQSTIATLHEFPQYSKYADDLENNI